MSIVSDLIAGGVQGIIDSITKAIATVRGDHTQLPVLEQEVEKAKIALLQLSVQADQAAMQAVNAAMANESKSEHFLQYSWRPLAAYVIYATVINNYILLPYFHSFGMKPIDLPDTMYLMFGAILGVTAWHRGMVQVEQVKQNGSSK